MLLLWAAGVATALVVVVGVLAFRDFSMRDTIDILLRTAVVVILGVLGWTWLDTSMLREHAAERRALDLRANELTARAIEPGSALACLNSLGNEAVEMGCEQAVFASPQTVAAAVAYVDARIALLADGFDHASRDRSYTNALEQPRRTLEADRFGFVAYVLASRGCTADECAAFKLLKDTSRVKANLKERVFEANVAQHAANWPSNNATAPVAATASPPAVALPSSAAGGPGVSRFSFPSAASIPPVNIMSAEPTGSTPPNNASGPSAEPPASERQPPAQRRQSTNRPAGQGASPQRLPPPPAASPPGPAPNR